MIIKVKLDRGAYMPERAHEADAGWDLRTREDGYIGPGGWAICDTGVHVALPEHTVGMLKSKSGLNVKFGIRSEGVIDSGYTGSIVVKLYNDTDKLFSFDKGDKISQLVVLPIPEIELEQVDRLDETERGTGGFGSTGK